MRLGLDGRICTGSYAVAQAWSDALRKHPVKPDGILFPSRHELSLPSCAISRLPGMIYVGNAGDHSTNLDWPKS